MQPQLGLILSTIEARGGQVSVAELRRVTQKILESHFLEPPEGILATQDSDQESEEKVELSEINDGELVDTFPGETGEIFELGGSRKGPGK